MYSFSRKLRSIGGFIIDHWAGHGAPMTGPSEVQSGVASGQALYTHGDWAMTWCTMQ